MHASMKQKLTDKYARYLAMSLDEDVVYIHKSSGNIKIAHPTGDTLHELPIEEAQRVSVYLGFEPTPGAYGTY